MPCDKRGFLQQEAHNSITMAGVTIESSEHKQTVAVYLGVGQGAPPPPRPTRPSPPALGPLPLLGDLTFLISGSISANFRAAYKICCHGVIKQSRT